MANPQRPSRLKWLFYITIMLLGVFLLGLFLFIHFLGITREDDLTLAEGVAADVERTQSARGTTHFVRFTVGRYRIIYGSDKPKFYDVVGMVESGQPMQIWVSTRRETLFRLTDLVPLYKLYDGNRAVLTYEETVASKSEQSWLFLVGGLALFTIGSWEVYLCFRGSRRGNQYTDATQVWQNFWGKVFAKLWPALAMSYFSGNSFKKNAIRRLLGCCPVPFAIMGVGIYFSEPYSITIGAAVGFLILFLLWLMSRNAGKSIGDAHE
jgi:hypothetical protein